MIGPQVQTVAVARVQGDYDGKHFPVPQGLINRQARAWRHRARVDKVIQPLRPVGIIQIGLDRFRGIVRFTFDLVRQKGARHLEHALRGIIFLREPRRDVELEQVGLFFGAGRFFAVQLGDLLFGALAA